MSEPSNEAGHPAGDATAKSVAPPPLRFAESQKLISEISAHTGHPVIAYWTSVDGSVCNNDVIALHSVLQTLGEVDELGLFVKSDGGSGEAALRMVHLLREYAKKVQVYVPLEASSAATMLSLGGDQIHMASTAQLSAVDTSLQHALSPLDRDNNRVRVSQDEVERVLRLWRESSDSGADNPFEHLYGHIHPLVFGAVDRISALSTRICSEILSYHMDDQEKINHISETLNSGYPSHSYPITAKEAVRIGLQVTPMDDKLLDLFLQLNSIYSEMGRLASTDIDENNSHDESILNIHETSGHQIFFQNQKDWYYRESERRWVVMNNKSAWKSVKPGEDGPTIEQFHIR